MRGEVLKRCEAKVALVTGGAAGIGRACVETLVAEGASVLIADIADDRGASLAETLGNQVAYQTLDVRQEEHWQRCTQFCLDNWGKLDILVNNAGIAHIAGSLTPETITLEEWRGVNQINTEGVVLGCKHAIASMRENGGAIVNIASVAALMESPLAYPYGASKAAVLQVTKTVAAYCARQGYEIRCNAVLPGIISTELYDKASGSADKQQSLAGVPMGRPGKPEHVAKLVAFLASDESAYITGAPFSVDGGLAATNPMRSGDKRPA